METISLAATLEREHHEIDAGIAAFTAAPADRGPLTRAVGALRRHIYLGHLCCRGFDVSPESCSLLPA